MAARPDVFLPGSPGHAPAVWDPAAWERSAGPVAQVFISVLDRAVSLQTGAIVAYVSRLRRAYPEASPAQLQARMDTHFLRLATGTGVGVGATAAIPGIGLLTGAAAIGAESLVFLDAAAFHALASAQLRGVDVTDPQRRRALILVALLGAQGSAIVAAFLGDVGAAGAGRAAQSTSAPAGRWISRLSPVKLGGINQRLFSAVLKRFGTRLTRGWVGKLMPLGVGAALGMAANRKLAREVIANTAVAFGPPEPTAREGALIRARGQ